MPSAERAWVAALLAIGCARAPAAIDAESLTVHPDTAAERACVEQAEVARDGLRRLADVHLWAEIAALLGRHEAASGSPRCAAATREVLIAAARRWAQDGVENGGSRVADLAQRAYRGLDRFPGANAALRHLFGRLEWTRATRLAGELGEQTLAAERYLAAHEHHAAALRGGGLTPEEARLSAVEQLEAMRRYLDYQGPAWDAGPWLCDPDPQGACARPPSPPVPGDMSSADAQMLAAYDLLLAEPATRGLPERPQYALQRAEILLRYGRFVDAEPDLRAAVAAAPDGSIGARAGLLLLRSLQARWQDPGAAAAARADARAAVIAAVAELRPLPAWSLALPPAELLRREGPPLRAAALWQAAAEARASGDLAACAHGFEDMSREAGLTGQDASAAALEAAICHEDGGAYNRALDGYRDWLAGHPGHPKAPEAQLRLARTHERVLNVEAARDAYIRFVELAPADPRADDARRRSITLGLVTGTLEEAQIEHLARDRRAGERGLAAAIRFRTEIRPDSAYEKIVAYIARFERDAGGARLAIAHVRAAEARMRSSCPVSALDGLCVEVTRDKTLGRVVPRDKVQLAQARAHLDAAAGLLGAVAAVDDGEGPPLAVEASELAAARRVLSLLRGDLGAEAALSTRPPASLDPERSRQWFERRTSEVAHMQTVYESVNPAAAREVALAPSGDAAESQASDRFSPVIEARKAQVFEADIGLLEEVAAAVAAKSPPDSPGAALAAKMRAQADERRGQVFHAYHRCIALVAAWGHDPEDRAEACRAGLGRLVQRYEARLEYAPNERARAR
jgi:tetratricopeptide (TPR) repeat protein